MYVYIVIVGKLCTYTREHNSSLSYNVIEGNVPEIATSRSER